MAEDPIVAELRAAAASLVTAAACAEDGDWSLAEQSALDAQAPSERVLGDPAEAGVTPPFGDD